MSSHTKRSEEFQDLIDHVCATLRTALTLKDNPAVIEAVALLEQNTTDNPHVLNAKPDEPIFVLQGGDKIVPTYELVIKWSERARTYLANEHQLTDQQREKLRDKISDAIACASEMRDYQ